MESLTELSGTLPGTYPLSILSPDNDSFVTASGTYWFTTTETSWITAVDYSLMSLNGDGISAMSHPVDQSTVPKRNIVARGFAAVQKRLIPRMALIQAGQNGDIKRVKTLLDLNVDTQIKDKFGMTVLYHAAEKGHEPVVRLLLERGADVNAQGGFYGNALQAASRTAIEGWWSCCWRGARTSTLKADTTATPCRPRRRNGDRGVVELLLERGADVNAQGGHYGNALQAASFNGHRGVVELLLERGADVNAQGGDYGNALQAASSNGDRGVVELLLERGADVKAASIYGDLGVVELLRAAADV